MPQNASHENRAISRRQLLKAIAAAGGAVAISSVLPGEWSEPVVEVGVLPAHAQLTQVEPGMITTCHAANSMGQTTVTPGDTLETWADISVPGPDPSGIQMTRTLLLDPFGTPSELDVTQGTTDGNGRFRPPDINLAAYILEDGATLGVLWQFVDPQVGTGTCQNTVDIIFPN